MQIYFEKVYSLNTIKYEKCAQRVNVQYIVLTVYETKPGKKL